MGKFIGKCYETDPGQENPGADRILQYFVGKDFLMTTSFIKGPLQMLFSSFCFAVMGLFAKLASSSIPGAEVALVRFGFGIGTALILAATGRIRLHTSSRGLLIARGVFGGGGILLYFIALAGGSLTNSTVLNNTYPIFATLTAAVALKERIGWETAISLILSWIGVGMLIHPDLHNLFWPDLLALISGVLGGVAIVVVRELRCNNEPAWTVFFYLSIFGFLASLAFALPVWVWPDEASIWYLLLTAVFGLVAQVTMTASYKYCRTAIGSILSMTTMVFTALIGLTFLGEKLTTLEAVGTGLIVLGCTAAVWLVEARALSKPSLNQ